MEFDLDDIFNEDSFSQNNEDSFGDDTQFNQLVFDESNVFISNDTGFLPNSSDFDSQIPGFDEWHYSTYGTPIADSLVWHQQTTPFTCGIVSSEMIMKMFGLDISESELVFEATSEGLLTENGMTIEGIQKILNNHNIEAHINRGDIQDLANELNAGHKIIIPLDSGEIWGSDSRFEDLFDERADHAVVLTGIDYDTIPPKVILNDPGHTDGKAMAVDMPKFIDAWNDSSNYYLSTD